MEVTELTYDNVEEYEGLLSDALLDNIGRKYHGGMVISDGGFDRICVSLFWDRKNLEIKSEDTICEMLDLSSVDPEGCDLLLSSFDGKNRSSGVKRAAFEFAGLEDDLSDSLKKYGLDIRRAESRDILKRTFVGDREHRHVVGLYRAF